MSITIFISYAKDFSLFSINVKLKKKRRTITTCNWLTKQNVFSEIWLMLPVLRITPNNPGKERMIAPPSFLYIIFPFQPMSIKKTTLGDTRHKSPGKSRVQICEGRSPATPRDCSLSFSSHRPTLLYAPDRRIGHGSTHDYVSWFFQAFFFLSFITRLSHWHAL